MRTVFPCGHPKWLEFLRQNEQLFNCELHLLATGQKKVVCLPENGFEEGSGWFLTFGDIESGEWNLAHPFGPPEVYHQFLDLFPAGEFFQLLVPTVDLPVLQRFRKVAPSEELIWHLDPVEPGHAANDTPKDTAGDTAISPTLDLPGEMSLRTLSADPSLWILEGEGGFIPRSYLMKNDSIVSMVRVIHATTHTLEVYIETIPDLREKGLATWLLKFVLTGFRAAGRRMIYVTAGDNLASRRVAQKVGLIPSQVLNRCPFRRT